MATSPADECLIAGDSSPPSSGNIAFPRAERKTANIKFKRRNRPLIQPRAGAGSGRGRQNVQLYQLIFLIGFNS
jgi:hypothetical protein